MKETQSMTELLEEERYWLRLEARAQSEGMTGETFRRCIDSIREEIAYREAQCSCGSHVHASS